MSERPDSSRPNNVISGRVRLITHTIDSSSAMRMNIARNRPVRRARSRRPGGSFPATIAMKMTLSMPRTISRTVSVRRAAHPSAVVIHSMFLVSW